MNIKPLVVSMAVAASLAACSQDDNDAEVRALESQVAELQQAIDGIETSNTQEVADLQATIATLQQQLADSSTLSASEISELESDLADMQAAFDALTASAPVLGANATQGANVLKADQTDTLRFAVFPDTQGRDDDNMRMYVDVSCDGSPITIQEYVGVDYNRDGFYDGGTESQADNVKPGDWDEDGVSYLVNVSDPFQPCIEMENGQPVVVAPEDRKDFGPDWKILPLPLVDAVTDKIIELDVDMVLAVGDYTEYRAESDYVMWMEHAAEPLKAEGISVFPVRGNHEIVNGRNWPAWFTNEQEWERQSVNNVYNDINPYDGLNQVDFDQGYRLYKSYIGSIVQEHLDNGTAIGFPGAEDLVYYFIQDNVLFIATDDYFSDITSGTPRGHWILMREWLKDVITSNAENVDHIIAFGHEPFVTKKRPHTYNVDVYEAYIADYNEAMAEVERAQAALDDAQLNSAPAEEIAALTVSLEEAQDILDNVDQPSINGYDLGQLGHLQLQDQADPGLADEILTLFADYKVTYISGHDHQYARSLVHPSVEDKDSTYGFMQIITGNASWKAYENEYGMNDEHETGLFINNFYDSQGGGDLNNSLGDRYASIHSSLGNGISFVLVEINGREITTTAYHVDHNLTETDMNLGAHYKADTNEWCTYTGDFLVPNSTPTTESCELVEWQTLDQNTRTTDAMARIVAPDQNYYAYTKTPEGQGYIGSEAAIMDGYNLTYNSSYARTVDQVERLREYFSLSWFVDQDAATLTDVLVISGNQTQEGSYFNHYGDLSAPTVDVDGGVLAEGESPSLTYVNQRGLEVTNPTHTARDGVFNKGVDIEASLNSANPNGNPGGNDANWTNRYLDDGLDFADAMTISFTAPEGANLEELTLGRYDEQSGTWVAAWNEDCYIESGYSDHMSIYYRISEQHPEGGKNIDNCQQRYWGYVPDANTVWGFVHTDGKFALIER